MAGFPLRCSEDRGDIILGWLTRITLLLGIAGLALFDAISIGTTAVTVSDQGDTAAREASEAWQSSKNLQEAYNAASASAMEQNRANVVETRNFTIDPDGTVHLTVTRDATTLVVYRIGPVRKWAHIERESEGKAVNG